MKDEKKTTGATTPSQFRLSPETLAELDLIAADRTEETGIAHSRTDAVRYAAKREADRVRKKNAAK